MDHIAGGGFEPPAFGLWARRATRLLHPAIINKGGCGIWTHARQDRLTVFKTVPLSHLGNPPIVNIPKNGNDPYGIWTHVTAVKGRCLNHLTNGSSLSFLRHKTLNYNTELISKSQLFFYFVDFVNPFKFLIHNVIYNTGLWLIMQDFCVKSWIFLL